MEGGKGWCRYIYSFVLSGNFDCLKSNRNRYNVTSILYFLSLIVRISLPGARQRLPKNRPLCHYVLQYVIIYFGDILHTSYPSTNIINLKFSLHDMQGLLSIQRSPLVEPTLFMCLLQVPVCRLSRELLESSSSLHPWTFGKYVFWLFSPQMNGLLRYSSVTWSGRKKNVIKEEVKEGDKNTSR